MPLVFAFGVLVLDSPVVAIFASFGSMSTILFVDFSGSRLERLQAQASLIVAGLVLISIGTAASVSVWAAAAVTLVVSLVVLFAGVISSVLASATTALLASFILPVSLPGGMATLPDRLLGWLLAGVASLVAITYLWPAPTREPLRGPTAHACTLLARRLRAGLDCLRDGPDTELTAALIYQAGEASAAVADLRKSFLGTPYRPTGLSTSARTLVRVVDEVIWLNAALEPHPRMPPPGSVAPQLIAVYSAAAALLERAADLLDDDSEEPVGRGRGRGGGGGGEDVRVGRGHDGEFKAFDEDVKELRRARLALEQTVTALPSSRRAEDDLVQAFVSSFEPTFRAQEMSFAVTAIAENIQLAVAARGRSWWDHVLGRRPAGVDSPLSSVRERAGAHVERHSVWLHNSIRGAAGLALAVLVADLAGVQHSFWVVFGTLAVLRSNALSTGQNALRGLAGTVAGIVIGGAVVMAIGPNTTVAWLSLPVAVALAGLAPAAFSFAAGQAAFTGVLLILFDIISPAGWEIGLVRIEDVAIGSGVSLLVGLLLWPHGASAALQQALAEGYYDSARYLRQAVAYAVSQCDGPAVPADDGQATPVAAPAVDGQATPVAAPAVDGQATPVAAPAVDGQAPAAVPADGGRAPAAVPADGGQATAVAVPGEEGRRAAAAARRLDDAFRTFLAERGSKDRPLAEVATLVTGVAVLRITADAILELWSRGDHSPIGDRTAARAELVDATGVLVDWYQQTALALTGAGEVPAPVERDSNAEGRLVDAVRQDLTGEGGRWTATAVRMLWTADHLDGLRRLQSAIAAPARGRT
ncbi:FUSC family protein [Kribbella catacumbae]|uniref:FUSC family protein n=1 Tax=Kribbella catacumbae TaxID=460086 RepID=UPI000371BDC7|nr:FUSC family protein [Kribbella catacumbae]